MDHRHEPFLSDGEPTVGLCHQHAGPHALQARPLWEPLLRVMSQALHVRQRISVCIIWHLVTAAVGQGQTLSFVGLVVPSPKLRKPHACDGDVSLGQRALVLPTNASQAEQGGCISSCSVMSGQPQNQKGLPPGISCYAVPFASPSSKPGVLSVGA